MFVKFGLTAIQGKKKVSHKCYRWPKIYIYTHMRGTNAIGRVLEILNFYTLLSQLESSLFKSGISFELGIVSFNPSTHSQKH